VPWYETKTNVPRRCATWGAEVVVGNLLDLDPMDRVIAGCETMYFGMSVSNDYLTATVNTAALHARRNKRQRLEESEAELGDIKCSVGTECDCGWERQSRSNGLLRSIRIHTDYGAGSCVIKPRAPLWPRGRISRPRLSNVTPTIAVRPLVSTLL